METTQKSKRFNPFRNNDLLTRELSELKTTHKKVLDLMRENKYRASDLPVSRRVLSHWRTLNLFDVYKNNPEQIQINYVALFWLQVVVELRAFGFSLENIDKVKQQLFSDPETPITELYIFLASTRKSLDVFILVSPDAEVIVGSKNEIETAEAFGLIEKNYIKLNFHILLNRIIKRKTDIIQQPFQSFLTDKESSILELIRDGEYKEIILNFSDGAVTHITRKTLEDYPNPMSELRNLISSGKDFCSVTFKMKNGKVVVMEKSIMEKT